MFSLTVDQKNRLCSLFENNTHICSQFEDRFSVNSDDIIFSIKKLLDQNGLEFSEIQNFIYIGEELQRFNAVLNVNLLEEYDHINRKEIIKVGRNEAEIFYLLDKFSVKEGVSLIWDLNNINVFLIKEGNIKKALFDVDEDNSIRDLFAILQDHFGRDLIKLLTIGSFLGDLSLYADIKDSCVIFEPDGRLRLRRDELRKMLVRYKYDQRLVFSLKKIVDDIFIHILNYIKFLTKENVILIGGDVPLISLAYTKMNQYIPFPEVFYDLLKIPEYLCRGALSKLFYDKGRVKDDKEDEKNILELIDRLFSDFHSEKIDNITKYFYYMDDDILVMIKDYLKRCKNIRMNFSHRNTVISSSGIKAWARLYFYLFARFKESEQPVILNYKVMVFFKKQSGSWEIEDLQFYTTDNLPILTLELSNSCNYKCIMCDTNRHRKKAFMSFDTFKNIIDSLERFKVGTVTPFWLGEALLNPHFIEMLDYAFEKNNNNERFISFTINTNGSMLDKKKTEAIIRNAKRKNMNENTFIRLHFSLDSNDKETYRKIHGAGDLNRVKENILYFLKRRKEEGLNYPKVTLAIIVMDENYSEVKDFVDYWTKVLEEFECDHYKTWDWPWLEKDAIYIRRLDCRDQDQAERLHYSVIEDMNFFKEESKAEIQETRQEPTETDTSTKDVHGRILNTDSVLVRDNMDYFIRRPCPALWKTPIVNTDGEVTVCCFDIDLSLRIGNINDRPLKEIWESDTIKSWRRFHLRGDFNRISRCAHCHNINSPTMKNAEFIDYIIGKDDIPEIEKAHFLG